MVEVTSSESENRQAQGDADPLPPAAQHKDSQTCPFCRREIKGCEAVSFYRFTGGTVEGKASAVDTDPSRDQESVEREQVGRAGAGRIPGS